ncbi:Nop52-domain-containing protein [Auricularia subglabra TFB-10046 SS5]|nr:Nop52-domain-containing protein [Auricularia subglabra TFB-10046 SS5]
MSSAEKKTRDKAVKAVAAMLADEATVASYPKAEMDKLWKALFFCYWMSDKPLVQQALSSELAELLLTIKSTTEALRFLRSFWETTVREWSGLDRFRMDKFYMLVRKYVNAAFRLLARSEWDDAACKEYNSMLTGRGCPLCPDDPKVPSSLAYHLSDIWLEELEKAMNNAEPSPPPAPLGVLLEPFISLAALTNNARTHERVVNSVFKSLFGAIKAAAKAPAPEDDGGERRAKRARLDEAARAALSPKYPTLLAHTRVSAAAAGEDAAPLNLGDLRKCAIALLFERASKEETRDSNRRKLYALWKEEMDDDEFAIPGGQNGQ